MEPAFSPMILWFRSVIMPESAKCMRVPCTSVMGEPSKPASMVSVPFPDMSVSILSSVTVRVPCAMSEVSRPVSRARQVIPLCGCPRRDARIQAPSSEMCIVSRASADTGTVCRDAPTSINAPTSGSDAGPSNEYDGAMYDTRCDLLQIYDVLGMSSEPTLRFAISGITV